MVLVRREPKKGRLQQHGAVRVDSWAPEHGDFHSPASGEAPYLKEPQELPPLVTSRELAVNPLVPGHALQIVFHIQLSDIGMLDINRTFLQFSNNQETIVVRISGDSESLSSGSPNHLALRVKARLAILCRNVLLVYL